MCKMYSTKFDDKLKKIDIYQKYPKLMPFIGECFSNSNPKMLFLGESHYLPSDCGKKLKDKWYSNDEHTILKECSEIIINDKKDGIEKGIEWLNTRLIINDDCLNNNNCNHKPFSIYKNIGKELNVYFTDKESKEYSLQDSFKKITFANYFLRPAEKEGKSINNNETDDEKSYEHLEELINILKIDVIFFVSSKAYKSFRKEERKHNRIKDKAKIFSLPHPGCAWWNRKTKKYAREVNKVGKISGRGKFKALLNQLF